MKVVVCAKQVVGTEAEKRFDSTYRRVDRTVENVLNPYDEYAVEEAVRLKEAGGGEITVLCMGPAEAGAAVRKALAMGADRAIMVSDPALAGSDTQGTAYALSEMLRTVEFDIALFGIMSTDAQSGLVPAAVAELLDLPLLSALNKVEFAGGRLVVRSQTDQGYVACESTLPAVCSVAKGINQPRYPSLKGIAAAKKKPLEVIDAASLSLDRGRIGGLGAKTRVLAIRSAPPRPPGVKVKDLGDGADKIIDFLLEQKLL